MQQILSVLLSYLFKGQSSGFSVITPFVELTSQYNDFLTGTDTGQSK